MNVLILHTPLSAEAAPDDQDVLIQADVVTAALQRQGHAVQCAPFALDLEGLRRDVGAARPDCLFNLVESVAGDGRFAAVATALLDHLQVPYTGSGTEAMFLTANKLLAKQWLRAAGIPTPEWRPDPIHAPVQLPAVYIVKPVWEDASVGIDARALLRTASPEELAGFLRARAEDLGKVCFAERYIEGREFNLSLLAKDDGCQVLPPAEIRFDLPGNLPRIVDYAAKWETDSQAYRGTTRHFSFAETDAPLLAELEHLAAACWHLFGLKGYARVDFRVDAAGRPWVLEINANPCLSPDAGFMAAVTQGGLTPEEAVARILSAALDGRGQEV